MVAGALWVVLGDAAMAAAVSLYLDDAHLQLAEGQKTVALDGRGCVG